MKLEFSLFFHFLRTLLTKKKSLRLVYESIKVLEIEILWQFLLIIGLHFLIPALAGKIFNPAAELLVLIGIPIKEAKTGTKTYPVTA